MSKSNNTSGGIGFAGLLTITFIILKLTDVINWSWFWVLFPSLIGVFFIAAILLFLGIVAIIALIKG